MRRCSYTAKEFNSSAQSALGVPQSRLKSILERPIANNANCPTARVGAYGHSLKKNVRGVKYDGVRQLHDLLVNLLSKWLCRAKIPHMSGVGCFKRTCKRLFTGFASQLPMPDLNNPAHTAHPRTHG